MPRRPDRPGPGPDCGDPDRADQDRASADRPGPGAPDELRRRLDSLPRSHPSSPWYRAARGQDRTGPEQRQDEPAEAKPGSSRRVRSEKYGVTGTGQDAAGATAAAGAARGRAADGTGRAPQQDKRAADDALWAQAARWQAADQARRQAAEQARRQARDRKPPSGPAGPAARREPFRPWFADSAGAEPWLTADGTGEPWFAPDGDGER